MRLIPYGIYGALGGTILALTYRSNDMIIYASHLLHRSSWHTYRRLLVNAVILASVIHVERSYRYAIHGYDDLFVYAVCLSGITIPVFIVVNTVFEWKCALTIIDYVRRGRAGN